MLLPVAACSRQPEIAPRPAASKADGGNDAEPKPLLELTALDPDIRLDIRYATKDNVTGVQLYDQARAFLVPAAAWALVRAQDSARRDGYGLLIHDAYRPWRVTKKLWDMTPRSKRSFVADPKVGSRHNRGCAVDLTLYHRATGKAAEMPSAYDEFSERAYRNYSGGSAAATANRARLEHYMQTQGFIGISNEWWHFDFGDWPEYPILDIEFANI
jgi:D-alanyl-D-alanine dipeptidase